MGFFCNKKKQERTPSVNISKSVDSVTPIVKENKKVKKEEDMTIDLDKVSALEEIVSDNKPVKKVKKDKGLIERTESSKVILTEDNKQLLMD